MTRPVRLLAALLLLPGAAPSGLYCLHRPATGSTNALAVAPAASGGLQFALSLWFRGGQNLTLAGTAKPTPNGWRYESDPACRLDIQSTGHAVRIAPIAGADCRNAGGYGTRLTTIRFPGTTRRGPVTRELSDPEAFQRACAD